MKVLLAPVEVAGAVAAIRAGLRSAGVPADLWVLAPHPFVRAEDRVVRGYARRAAAGVAALRYDVLHYHFGTTLAEFADAALARAARRVAVMHYWGDDCRIRTGTAVVPAGAGAAWHAAQRAHERLIRRRLRIAGRVCHAALVSDLELLGHVRPYFRTVYVVPTPLALPLPAGTPPAPLAGEGPIVLHAPSDRLLKGSTAIAAAVEATAARRPLRSVTVSGVPHAAVLGELARADIVIDQLHSATSGILALEAMALGKPVLIEYRRELLAPFARDTPLIAVTADTLERELDALAGDPERRERVGRAGREFVARVHDARAVAGSLRTVYADARTRGPGVFAVTGEGIRPLPSSRS